MCKWVKYCNTKLPNKMADRNQKINDIHCQGSIVSTNAMKVINGKLFKLKIISTCNYRV